jgi:hypothetical protein
MSMLSTSLLRSQIFLTFLYEQKGVTRRRRDSSNEEFHVSILLFIQYPSDDYIEDRIGGKFNTHGRIEKSGRNFLGKL